MMDTPKKKFRLEPGWAMTIAFPILLGAVLVSALQPRPVAEPAPTVTVTATPEATPTYDAETRFAEVVVQNGVEDRDVNRARGVALTICHLLEAGETPKRAVELATEGWGYGARPTAAVIGTSSVFCPAFDAVIAPLATLPAGA
jgi:hypothetical protein